MNPSTWTERRLSSHFIQDCPRSPKRRFRFWPAAVPLAVLVAMIAGSAGAQTITEFPVPTADSGPNAIVTGTDGVLWFTNGSTISRITTTGVISDFAGPRTGLQKSIAAGPDGQSVDR